MTTAISVNKYIYSILNNDKELRDIVGNKIYPLIADNNVTFPFIIFKKTNVNTQYTKDGRLYDYVEFSIVTVSTKYETGIDIAERVRELLECKESEYLHQTRLSSINEDFIDDAYVQELVFTAIVN